MRVCFLFVCPYIHADRGGGGSVAGVGTAVACGIVPKFIEFHKFSVVVILWLAFAALADVIIALSLVFHLVRPPHIPPCLMLRRWVLDWATAETANRVRGDGHAHQQAHPECVGRCLRLRDRADIGARSDRPDRWDHSCLRRGGSSAATIAPFFFFPLTRLRRPQVDLITFLTSVSSFA